MPARLTSTVLLAAAAWVIALTPALCAPGGPASLTIPVFYLTDREQKGASFGPNRKYVLDCKHDPFYGRFLCTIKNTRRVSDNPTRLDWRAAAKKRGKPCPKEPVAAADPEQAADKFFTLVADAVAKSGTGELVVFVHGTRNTFEHAAEHAAELAYAMRRPVVLYSWPSVGKLLSYEVDEDNVAWSLEHFHRFLAGLKKAATKTPFKVVLVAHSLGTRLVMWGYDSIYKNPLFREVVLICPDIDSEIFKHHRLHYVDDTTKVRLYVSTKDRVLPLSQMMKGGYYRLGSGMDTFIDFFTDPKETIEQAADLFNKPWLGLGSDPAQAAPLSPDKLPFETIDYTEIDRGFWGHSIPYDLLANMSQTGTPGPGLALKREIVRKVSPFTRFIRWCYDLAAPPAGEHGMCQRVVRQKN